MKIIKHTLIASVLLTGLTQAATYTQIINTGGLNDFTGAVTDASGALVMSYSVATADGGVLSYDAVLSQFSGSSFTAAGGIVHGTQVTTHAPNAGQLIEGRNADIGGHSFTVDITNLAYDNAANSYVTPGLSFDGFPRITEGLTGGSAALIGFNESPGLVDIPTAIYNFAAPLDTFEVFIDEGFTGTYRLRLLNADFTFPDTIAIPEPSSTALLGLGGIALLARRRRS